MVIKPGIVLLSFSISLSIATKTWDSSFQYKTTNKGKYLLIFIKWQFVAAKIQKIGSILNFFSSKIYRFLNLVFEVKLLNEKSFKQLVCKNQCLNSHCGFCWLMLWVMAICACMWICCRWWWKERNVANHYWWLCRRTQPTSQAGFYLLWR